MFSIAENIYFGWQYFLNLLSLVGGNFHIVIDYVSKFSVYISNFFQNLSLPIWISCTLFSILGFGIVFKLCHWG